MLGHALGAFLPGMQYLLFGAVVGGVVVDQPAFVNRFEHSDIAQCVDLLARGADDIEHGAARHESVREMVAAIRQSHAEGSNSVHASAAGQFLHLLVSVEAVHELHVAASSHRLISSCDSVVVHRIQSFFELRQAWWGPRKNSNIFHHMLPNRL